MLQKYEIDSRNTIQEPWNQHGACILVKKRYICKLQATVTIFIE